MLFKEGYLNLPLKLEIPVTPTEFKLGLMFRESLDEDCGMLFVFSESSEKSFHMNHTHIPLDIAFINASGIIESIKELKPLNPVPVYSDAEVLYALEVNRGWFAENNVNVGDQILNTLSEDVEVLDANGNLYATVIDLIKPEPMKGLAKEDLQQTVGKVLDRGTKFVKKNPVGKVLGAIVSPVKGNTGKNYPTASDQKAKGLRTGS